MALGKAPIYRSCSHLKAPFGKQKIQPAMFDDRRVCRYILSDMVKSGGVKYLAFYLIWWFPKSWGHHKIHHPFLVGGLEQSVEGVGSPWNCAVETTGFDMQKQQGCLRRLRQHERQSATKWWFGTWILYFSIQLGSESFPTDFHSTIFQDGFSTTKQICFGDLPQNKHVSTIKLMT